MIALQKAVHDCLVLFAMVNAFGSLPILWELTHTGEARWFERQHSG